ncbi:MAG: tRNA (adenosine(37)-N6)-threonylcarbamoyltransferase complex transferase subunit TsaD [Candidatus Woesearchaeota archaeon]|nr:MAG: tRNA (adenosine(37)-N6)-threonylcarbamoyltransferase complex transferase subunit TsaD [Candidatus Woesearchaeota archaeon]
MLCLSFEGTAHTCAVAIVNAKKQISADQRDQYTTEKGGIIPNEAAAHHKKLFPELLKKALLEAKVKSSEIDLIAYSRGPGLPPCLHETLNFTKYLANELKIPVVGVNHSVAHLTSAELLYSVKNPIYVYAAGPNTQIISLEGKRFRIMGEVLSIGVGNALDKFAREVGLGFPGGPKVEQLAKNGKYVELPYVVKGMDIELSGIITKAIDLHKKGVVVEDLCFSLQETMFAMLTEVTERALAHTQKNEVVLVGGVAANKRLCEMLDIMCRERDAKFYAVPLKYSGDQAVMIAWQGIKQFNAGDQIHFEKLDMNPLWRTDQVEVIW